MSGTGMLHKNRVRGVDVFSRGCYLPLPSCLTRLADARACELTRGACREGALVSRAAKHQLVRPNFRLHFDLTPSLYNNREIPRTTPAAAYTPYERSRDRTFTFSHSFTLLVPDHV
jgi:hypothetical protein